MGGGGLGSILLGGYLLKFSSSKNFSWFFVSQSFILSTGLEKRLYISSTENLACKIYLSLLADRPNLKI